jgi:hypothetical protein
VSERRFVVTGVGVRQEQTVAARSALRASADGSVVEISTRGARAYAMFCDAMIVGVAALILLSPTNGRDGSATTVWMVLIAIAGFAGAVYLFWRAARLVVSFGPTGILVRNWYRTYRIAWADVVEFADGTVTAGEGGPAWALAIRRRSSDRRRGCRASSMARKAEQPAIVAAIHYVGQRYGVNTTCEGRLRPELPVVSDPMLRGSSGDAVRSVRLPTDRRGYRRAEVINFFDGAAATLDHGIRPERPRYAFKTAPRGFARSRVDELVALVSVDAPFADLLTVVPSSPQPRTVWNPSDYPLPRSRPPLAAFAVVSLLALGGAGIVVVAANTPASGTAGDHVAGRREVAFTARDAHFRAVFPTEPTRSETTDSGVGTTIVYSSDQEDSSYGVWSVPSSISGLDLAGLAKESTPSSARIVSGHAMRFKGEPAYEQITFDSSDHLYDEQLDFVAGDRLYRIDVTGTQNPPDGAGKFIDSMQVTP